MNEGALGIFDSGVGGLTVARAVMNVLPGEHIVYLGDTARLPYGSKSPETIRQFADEDVKFLLGKGVKAIVVACNTATAHALPSLRARYRVPIMGVIEPGVEAVCAVPGVERVGIIATRGTIAAHAYQHALATRRTGLLIHAVAAPLLVPLIEEGWLHDAVTRTVLKHYLEPVLAKGIDALLLACTHYPLLMPMLNELLPPSVRVIDSASTCAEHLRAMLTNGGLLAHGNTAGSLEVWLTDLSEQFEELASRFLQCKLERVRRATLGA